MTWPRLVDGDDPLWFTPLMRIAVIAPPWTPIPPPLYGGIELIIDKLAFGYHKAGHDVTLFATGDSTCPVKRESVYDSPAEPIGSIIPEFRQVIHAYERARALDVDIIHDHTVAGPLYAGRSAGPPVVTTLHGPFDEDLTPIYEQFATRASLVAISDAQRRAAPHVPVAEVIHHGLEPDEFPFGAGPGRHCLFLGRMTPEKGVARAVEVARRAGLPLLIAAKMREAHEKAYFAEQVEPQLGGEIEYLGEVSHEEKLELLHHAICLLFPIRWPEPFGLVMLEALACGTPVLAFPEGAAPEVVADGRTGFLCEDETQMVDALSRIGTIDRAECRRSLEADFSARRMVERYCDLFEKVAGGTGQTVPRP